MTSDETGEDDRQREKSRVARMSVAEVETDSRRGIVRARAADGHADASRNSWTAGLTEIAARPWVTTDALTIDQHRSRTTVDRVDGNADVIRTQHRSRTAADRVVGNTEAIITQYRSSSADDFKVWDAHPRSRI